MQSVEGKVAVVTGAASGIGLGMARAFTGAGMRVVLADVREDALREAVDALRADGHDVIGVPTDVSKLAEVEALASATLDAFGAVHVLCNNAGVGLFSPIAKSSIDDWEWALSIDLWGPIYGVKTFLPLIEQQSEGHINSTSSLAGLVAGATAGAVQRREARRRRADGHPRTRAASSQVAGPNVGAVPGRGEHRHQHEQPGEPPRPPRCRRATHPRRRQGRRQAPGGARSRHGSRSRSASSCSTRS